MIMGDPTIAEPICDQLFHVADEIDLEGWSLR